MTLPHIEPQGSQAARAALLYARIVENDDQQAEELYHELMDLHCQGALRTVPGADEPSLLEPSQWNYSAEDTIQVLMSDGSMWTTGLDLRPAVIPPSPLLDRLRADIDRRTQALAPARRRFIELLTEATEKSRFTWDHSPHQQISLLDTTQHQLELAVKEDTVLLYLVPTGDAAEPPTGIIARSDRFPELHQLQQAAKESSQPDNDLLARMRQVGGATADDEEETILPAVIRGLARHTIQGSVNWLQLHGSGATVYTASPSTRAGRPQIHLTALPDPDGAPAATRLVLTIANGRRPFSITTWPGEGEDSSVLPLLHRCITEAADRRTAEALEGVSAGPELTQVLNRLL